MTYPELAIAIAVWCVVAPFVVSRRPSSVRGGSDR